MTDELPEELPLTSMDVATEKRDELRRILTATFPEAVTEDKIDLDQLKRVLGEWVEPDRERFGLNWPGKAACMKVIQAPSVGTLKPSPAESVDWDSTQNLFIEGDNLEALKLLQKAYFGKIKLIFIDPPYNTGREFIYPDKFAENIETYLQYTGQKDTDGKKFSTNTDTSGRYHSRWLNMIYPRLYLSKNLLRDDGVIFITIGDAECDNLKKLCAEIFGEENFVAHIVWQKKYAVSQDDPGIASMHDHILVYSKSSSFQRNLLPRTEKQTQRYTNTDNDPRGPWSADNYISNNSREERPTLWYPIIHPRTGAEVWPKETAVWRYSRDKHATIVEENRLYWGPNQSYERPRIKRFLSEVQDGVVPSTWWPFEEVGHNDEGQKETAELIGPKIFTTPKPVRLIRRIIQIATDADSIVLDFFAGAATTGHAVVAQNASDGGKRRFILVQLPEPTRTMNSDGTWDESPAWKAGFPTIAHIARERLRRAFTALTDAELGKLDLQNQAGHDRGFRTFKLAASNFAQWDGDIGEAKDTDLIDRLTSHAENISPDASEDDILFELLLKDGFELSVPVERLKLSGKEVFAIADGALLICIDRELTQEALDSMAERDPSRVICLDAGFRSNDQLKANAVQAFRARARSRETAIEFRTI